MIAYNQSERFHWSGEANSPANSILELNMLNCAEIDELNAADADILNAASRIFAAMARPALIETTGSERDAYISGLMTACTSAAIEARGAIRKADEEGDVPPDLVEVMARVMAEPSLQGRAHEVHHVPMAMVEIQDGVEIWETRLTPHDGIYSKSEITGWRPMYRAPLGCGLKVGEYMDLGNGRVALMSMGTPIAAGYPVTEVGGRAKDETEGTENPVERVRRIIREHGATVEAVMRRAV